MVNVLSFGFEGELQSEPIELAGVLLFYCDPKMVQLSQISTTKFLLLYNCGGFPSEISNPERVICT